MFAFDADDIRRELWNSSMNPARDRLGQLSKFATPTIASGRVYVPTFSGEVAVYGLLQRGPRIDAIASAAGFQGGGVAPGQLVVVSGAGFGPATAATLTLGGTGRVSTRLGGMRALFDGVPAPVYLAWSGQVRAIVPYSVAGRASTLVGLEQNGRIVSSITVPVAASAPGLFTMSTVGIGQGAILNQDHTVNSPLNPVFRGSVIVLYGTGEGQTDPPGVNGKVATFPLPKPTLPVSVVIDGREAELLYAGAAPGLVSGVIQVNARVPEETRRGDDVGVVFSVGEAASQPGVTIAVR
jgi:uncharacterized protein (TIGR03437 family)